MRNYLTFLFVIFIIPSIFAQQITNWKNYSDLRKVASVVFSDDAIWSATDGGGFKYSLTDETFRTLTKSDGIRGIALTSVTADGEGNIWFGSSEGMINIYKPESNSFDVITDITNSEQTNKSINYLIVKSDTLIVSSEFGVSLIDVNNYIFFDTFFKFGDFTTNTNVNFADKLGPIYVCTDEGLAVQKNNATNLSAPESWNTYNSLNGLPGNITYKVAEYNNSILVATNKGLAEFNGSVWSPFLSQFNNQVINDIQTTGDSLFILTGNKIYLYRNNVTSEVYSSPSTIARFSVYPRYGIAATSTNGALLINTNGSASFLIPNGPAANQFPNMSVSDNGVLWSASGKDGAGVGFYSYNKNTWKNYNVSNVPGLSSNDVYSTYTAPDNTAYLGTWGRGFLKTDGETFTLFNRDNTGMQGIPSNPNFLVITGFGTDSRNNLWVLNYAAADRKTLSMLEAGTDTTWYHFSINAELSRSVLQHYNLVIDPYDTKWLSSYNSSAIIYFNEMKTYDNTSDDRSGYLTTLDGLSNSNFNAVAVDKRGDIWIGTALGADIITNPSSILSAGSSSINPTPVFSLRQQSINDIAVDPINQKWIATNEGLLLVNSDGSNVLAFFNTDNSPLLSNRIESIAIDENDGIVYVGTDRGLASFETPFLKPEESFDKLFMYPNPYVVDGSENYLTIDGLIKDSEIKVLNIDGVLISEFSSPGGRIAFWDGRDTKGNLVNSGVYIIVAYDNEGNNIITGKVAVLRK